MPKYSIGLDYGTLSGRAVLVNLSTGEEIATSVKEYTHAVMDEYLTCGDKKIKLPNDFALQHPADYLEVLQQTIPNVLRQANVSAEDVVGVGIDFTACTILPILKDGTPICFLDEYKENPHAYVKLWKHHAAQDKADKLNEIALSRGETFLARYGGKISSEWVVPKVWEILDKAEDIYNKADRIIEAADWIAFMLTGVETRNACTAGYKALWHKKDGYPSKEFYKALDPRLENLVEEKLGISSSISPIGAKAGVITAESSSLTGLKIGTAVAVGNVDAHVAVPAAGITDTNKMLIIMGTSSCHMLLGENEVNVGGMCGVVEDGILSGFMGYEAGQSCVGDHFDWFVKNLVPEKYTNEAIKKGINIHKLLREKAIKLKTGESGLLALDWWNGNRSVLVDTNLTGLIMGMTLTTKPEEIYRALIEATAYGTRTIVEAFQNDGVPVDEIVIAGGIAQKDEMMMQIYADVTNRPIRISASTQTPALGSALFGAVVAGKENGGFATIEEAAAKLGKLMDKEYMPNPDSAKIYDKLFAEYKILHDYFGRGVNDVMKRVKSIKNSVE